tara:strand:- start:432 stop:1118 length:687 start_codon:yes stop_codon:yes gene_type:complete
VKNIEKESIEWWDNKNKPTNPLCPNLNIFRLLKINNFKFSSKKSVFDIGFGNGENLLEFKKRGLSIFGLDYRDKLVKYFIKKNKLNKKNFFFSNLNKKIPNIKNKFNLVLMCDVLSYIEYKDQKKIFEWIDKHLNKNGLFLFTYTQNDLILKKNIYVDNWEISKKLYKIKKINFDKKNPMKFLELKKILSSFKETKLNFLSSHFDISTYSKKNSSKIRIGRFVLMKKK